MDNQILMNFISNLAAVFIGGVITWLTAKYYYEKASKELTKEADELKKKSVLMLRGIESTGMVEFSRDHEGNHKGLVHRGGGDLKSQPASLSGQDTD